MKIITIDREFGAGGHSVGRAVAAQLGIPFYDRDIIKQAAADSGMATDELCDEEEVISKADAFIRAITPISYDPKETVFENERTVILDLANEGPCVILGRCASAILGEEGIDVLRVFLYASEDDRLTHAKELVGTESEAEARRRMRKMDTSRRAYYERFTSKHWGADHDFDMLLNSGALGYEACVRAILAAAQ